jgi:probable F420-dependent oxidoreductase
MAAEAGSDLLAGHFGTYILPGRVTDPPRGVEEAQEAERLGLGSVWLSERFGLKEPAVMAGALSQATNRVQIRSTFYATMRHPLVLASIANMMQAMSGDRFGLVFARALPAFLEVIGAKPVTFERLGDAIQILRKLCAGETVSYSGILGEFPTLKLSDYYAGTVPPIIMTAMGPQSLAFAGRNCDGVFLHPFLSPVGVAASAKIVRDAAEKAGRDAASVRIYPNVIVAPDLPPEQENLIVRARAMSYFDTKIGDFVAKYNGWDVSDLAAARNHPKLLAIKEVKGQSADALFSKSDLVEVGRLLPQRWLDEGAAAGTAAECARKLIGYLDAGGDHVVLHGSSPHQMGQLSVELKTLLIERQG